VNLEREAKLSVGPLFRMPDLTGSPEGVEARGIGTQRFVTSYHDTPDLRLARWGVSLRYRTGEGWTVKLPRSSEVNGEGPILVREEHTFEAGPGKPPPAAIDLVRAYVRTSPVSLAVRLQTLRRRIELIADEDVKVAEVVDDEVSVLDGRRVVGRFRELEVELGPEGDREALRSVVRRLEQAGAEPSPGAPKHVQALQPRSTQPPEVFPPRIGRKATVEEVVRTALSASVARLIANDAAVRLGEDPEGVHQARVATRRLRSDLRTFRSFLDRDRDGDLRGELEWLGAELGVVRDLDVLGQRLRAHAASLPDEDAGLAPKLLDRLRVQREEARAALLSAMREDRYVRLLDSVVAAATEPAVLDDHAGKRGSDFLSEIMNGPWQHLSRTCQDLGPNAADSELHEARIRAKRVRYAAEAMLPVSPKRAGTFAARAADLQEILGEHQDAVVAAAWLRSQGSGTTPRVAFSAGELAAVQGRAADKARRRWPRAWRALSDEKLRYW
jgi:CHAD domain-containing protein